ncbi:MAG: FecR family protein [Pedobacter sp.]|nr:MAG: FecR family protein [Pedobacter sp.]
MNTEVINDLAQKFMKGTATAEEKALLHDWYALELKADEEVVIVGNEGDQEEMKRRLYASVMRRLEVDEVDEMVMGDEKRLSGMQLWPNGWFRYGAGIAAALAMVVFGVWFFYASRHPEADQDALNAQYANDIKPGSNRATLTLANGKTIALSEAKAGVVIDASTITYSDHTIISETDPKSGSEEQDWSPGGKDLSHTFEMTSVTTPMGGTYQVMLPDGSRVWLNAASKISFPSQFPEGERVVSLQGEAYFEVKKERDRPFIVESPGQSVEVLGTHFNINSYENEGVVRTTLLEGSVRVGKSASATRNRNSDDVRKSGSAMGIANSDVGKRAESSVVLKPNEQAVLDASAKIKVLEVNPNDVIDWKRGDFVFRGESLENVMRRVSRWYDVEVSYASEDLKSITVGGFVSRSRSISAVLELMERTGKLTFKIEGRKVFVSK